MYLCTYYILTLGHFFFNFLLLPWKMGWNVASVVQSVCLPPPSPRLLPIPEQPGLGLARRLPQQDDAPSATTPFVYRELFFIW